MMGPMGKAYHNGAARARRGWIFPRPRKSIAGFETNSKELSKLPKCYGSSEIAKTSV